jgi:DNA-binding transcriptional LysR family regulator
MHDLDTSLLRTFVSLADTRSFSRTAGRIGRSQSAVSGQIKKLEALMGRALVHRDTRNVALTMDGERLLVHARQMIAAADRMLARFSTAEITGEVRFGSPEDFASAYLPDVLAAFARAHAGVRLHVSCELTLRLIERFEAGEHDLVIVKQDATAIHAGARPLWREDLVWVGPADGGATGEAGEGPSPDRPLPLVLSPAPCVYRKHATAALDAAQMPWTCVYESPSHAGCVAAVRAGLGHMVMPRAMTPPDLAPHAIGGRWPVLPATMICLLGQARLTPAAQALASFIEERLTRAA